LSGGKKKGRCWCLAFVQKQQSQGRVDFQSMFSSFVKLIGHFFVDVTGFKSLVNVFRVTGQLLLVLMHLLLVKEVSILKMFLPFHC